MSVVFIFASADVVFAINVLDGAAADDEYNDDAVVAADVLDVSDADYQHEDVVDDNDDDGVIAVVVVVIYIYIYNVLLSTVVILMYVC